MANGVANRNDLPLELQILELFKSAQMIALGPTDVEKFLGVSKGTVSAKLKTLAGAGYLTPNGNGKYTAGSSMLSLATSYFAMVFRQADEVQAIVNTNMETVKRVMRQMMDTFDEDGAES